MGGAFLSYLWGIETRSSLHLFARLRGFYRTYEELKRFWGSFRNLAPGSFYRTYEELKPMNWYNNICPLLVFIVPMRNWNPKSFGEANQRKIVFIVPMRNWNPVQWICIRLPQWVFIVPMRNWNWSRTGFQWCAWQFLSYLWGIETRVNLLPSEPFSTVFIVPMRNWNFFLASLQFYLCRFLSYLWGIETRDKQREECGDLVFIVPMRNWNSFYRSLYSCRKYSFYRTYEELKHFLPFAFIGKGNQFLSYLWGIETRWS